MYVTGYLVLGGMWVLSNSSAAPRRLLLTQVLDCITAGSSVICWQGVVLLLQSTVLVLATCVVRWMPLLHTTLSCSCCLIDWLQKALCV
jgi:hypothetical protein